MSEKGKQCFVRGVWGTHDHQGRKRWNRLNKVKMDISLAKINPYEPKIKVYAFGEDNYKFMVDQGFDTKLVDKKCIVWDMQTQQYRHKIEVWNQGLQDFEQIIYLDWDCIPCCPIPHNIWTVLEEGEPFRGALYSYRRRKCFHRYVCRRTVVAATFLYMRGQQVVKDIIKTWEEMGGPFLEEPVLMKYVDDINGGWKGYMDYAKKYEPLYHTLHLVWPREFLETREMVFFHCGITKIKKFLRDADKVKQRLDEYYEKMSNGLIIING